MNINRLANVIFEKGEKISESTYKQICEDIKNDSFTLNEHTIAYKQKEEVFGKLFFILEDNSRVLVDDYILENINSLNMNTDQLQKYMAKSITNFSRVMETLIDGNP